MSSTDEEGESNAVVVELAASVGGPKTTTSRCRFPKLTKGDKYPFLEQPCVRDLTIFKCLLSSQPFAVGKGTGLTAAWSSAVEEINKQVDPLTGENIFDPPIAMKTVRERFNQAMKVIAKIENGIPFRSGTDDEESPNELRVMLEDLYCQKKDYDSAAADIKLVLWQKRKMIGTRRNRSKWRRLDNLILLFPTARA